MDRPNAGSVRSADTQRHPMLERLSETMLYRYKQPYDGLLPSEVKKLRQLEAEKARLRRGVTLCIGPG